MSNIDTREGRRRLDAWTAQKDGTYGHKEARIDLDAWLIANGAALLDALDFAEGEIERLRKNRDTKQRGKLKSEAEARRKEAVLSTCQNERNEARDRAEALVAYAQGLYEFVVSHLDNDPTSPRGYVTGRSAQRGGLEVEARYFAAFLAKLDGDQL